MKVSDKPIKQVYWYHLQVYHGMWETEQYFDTEKEAVEEMQFRIKYYGERVRILKVLHNVYYERE